MNDQNFESALNLIVDHELFEGIKKTYLVNFVKQMKPRKYESKEIIFKEGSSGKSLLILLSGQLDLFKGEKHISTVYPPTLLGDVSFLSGKKRGLKALAKTDCQFLSLEIDSFYSALGGDKKIEADFLKNLIKVISLKLGHSNNNLNSILEERKKLIDEAQGIYRKVASLGDPYRRDLDFIYNRIQGFKAAEQFSNQRQHQRFLIPGSYPAFVLIDSVAEVFSIQDLSEGGFQASVNPEHNWEEDSYLTGKLILHGNFPFDFEAQIRWTALGSIGCSLNSVKDPHKKFSTYLKELS